MPSGAFSHSREFRHVGYEKAGFSNFLSRWNRILNFDVRQNLRRWAFFDNLTFLEFSNRRNEANS
jgi:hypothetical protein